MSLYFIFLFHIVRMDSLIAGKTISLPPPPYCKHRRPLIVLMCLCVCVCAHAFVGRALGAGVGGYRAGLFPMNSSVIFPFNWKFVFCFIRFIGIFLFIFFISFVLVVITDPAHGISLRPSDPPSRFHNKYADPPPISIQVLRGSSHTSMFPPRRSYRVRVIVSVQHKQ